MSAAPRTVPLPNPAGFVPTPWGVDIGPRRCFNERKVSDDEMEAASPPEGPVFAPRTPSAPERPQRPDSPVF